jgi:hypothetical protein
MKNYGINLIKKNIIPLLPEIIADQESEKFIKKMLEFFMISPSTVDPPVFRKLYLILDRHETRFKELIQTFIPNIDETSLSKISALIKTTAEIDHLYRKVRHNLIVGEKTKSYWYLLQSASEITQTMLKAQAYQIALKAFTENHPIGDSIGPLVIHKFIHNNSEINGIKLSNNPSIKSKRVYRNVFSQTKQYKNRTCICLRAKGPEINLGHPGQALKRILKNSDFREKVSLILTIDASSRLEGETPGSISHGIGVAIGSGENDKSKNIEKFQIEDLALNQNPPISLETIIVRESFEESVSPMIPSVRAAVPKIIRVMKEIIRNKTKKGDIVIIIGIGNSIGVPI